MKIQSCILLVIGIICSASTIAQIQFEQIRPIAPLPTNITEIDGIQYSSIAFADIDNDGDDDLLITGLNYNYVVTKLYKNDGLGNFSVVTGTPFEKVYLSSIAFADIDNDGDQDVLITGKANDTNGQPVSKLYSNDGSGNFSVVGGTTFEGVQNSSIAFADINGDGDQDVLITGSNSSNQSIAKLYSNNGSGNFSLVAGSPFTGVRNSSIAFSDSDNDGDQDLLITGNTSNNSSIQPISKMYSNNGSGTFTEIMGTPFIGVEKSSVAFEDIDNDGDQDLLITGGNSSETALSRLYTNNGTGLFSLVSNAGIYDLFRSSIAFSDIDNDGDNDLLITGINTILEKNTFLYTNDGIGNYSMDSTAHFEKIGFSSIAFSDVDNDGDQDVLITGQNSAGVSVRVANLYMNDGMGDFLLASGTAFENLAESSSISFADVDLDGDKDVVIGGTNIAGIAKVILYKNDGSGNFTEAIEQHFEGAYGAVEFGDIDNDGDPDLLVTGSSNISSNIDPQITKLYRNDGTGNFTEITSTGLEAAISDTEFADIDGDGDLDVILTGWNNAGLANAKMYRNNGSGYFTLITGTPFIGVYGSSVGFSDVDNDGDKDILITGHASTPNQIGTLTRLYLNDGTGNFTEVTVTNFIPVYWSNVSFADIDNDGDEDVLITGATNSGSLDESSKLYRNDGSGNFSLIIGTPFEPVFNGNSDFSDVDGDGDMDVLISGVGINSRITKLYINNGYGSFSLIPGMIFETVVRSSIKFEDVDGDNDEDVLITGVNTIGMYSTKLYRNTSCISVINYNATNGTLVANNALNYQWINCQTNSPIPGATNQTFTPTSSTGSYAVTILNVDSCSYTSPCFNMISLNTLTFEEEQIQVYPNPFNDEITVNMPDDSATYLLADPQGKIISQGTVTKTISVRDLNSGIYFLTIQTQNGVYSKSLIKN